MATSGTTAKTSGLAFDPEWIEFEERHGPILLPNGMPARRHGFNNLLIDMQKHLPPTDPSITARDEPISSDVTIRVYTPGQASSKLPVLIYYFGGGWLSGALDTEDHLCRYLCGQVNCIVVAVGYPLFPETSFANIAKASFEAYQWIYNHAPTFNGDPTRLILGGGSAGGGLAIHIAYRLMSSGHQDRISGLISIQSMALDPSRCPKEYAHIHKSHGELAGWAPLITAEAIQMCFKGVIGSSTPYDEAWFPQSLGAGAFRGFPPTYITNAGLEAMRDDGAVLERELRDAGVPVKRDVAEGLPHYFHCFPLEKAGARFREEVVQGVRWILEQGSGEM